MKRTIGIIGGMGPLATVDLFSKIVHLTDAQRDIDHPHIIIDDDPGIPGRVEAILNGGEDPGPAMCRSARRLEAAGADFLIIGCNTAHYYFSQVEAAVQIPVLNMLEITAREITARGFHKVGLLATDGVLRTHLYEQILRSRGITTLVPDTQGQKEVMRIIFEGVKAGKTVFDVSAVAEVLRKLFAEGAETLVLGCTELPLAFKQYGIEAPCIDPTMLLAREAVKVSGAVPVSI